MADKVKGPSPTEVLEFAKRTKVLNLEVPIETVLEHASIVTPGAEKMGYVLAWDKYVLVVGLKEETRVLEQRI